MSANPIDKNPTPDSTGSLEDLFRHHLGEEAAVPPRPLLWDQIDNSLLIRQNETYRRRLVATRWVAAASLLLATLAGTGWWATRYAGSGSPDVATTSRPTGGSTATSAGTTGIENSYPAGRIAAPVPTATSPTATSPTVASGAATSMDGVVGDAIAGSTAASGRSTPTVAVGATGRYTGFGVGAGRAGLAGDVATSSRKSGRGSVARATRGTAAPTGPDAFGGRAAFAARSPQNTADAKIGAKIDATAATEAADATTGYPAAARSLATSRALAVGSAATAAPVITTTATSGLTTGATAIGPLVAAAPTTTAGAAAGEVGLFAAHPAALSLATPAPLPNGLATLALPAETDPLTLPATRKWRYGASYTAGAFNPNINFSRADIGSEYAYNPALGANSPALTEAAAAQYRENLRPGLSQRLALLATHHLAGHWSLRTGAELTQATARSESTSGFVGEQLYDLGPYSTGPRRTTNFRYRLASIPVELRYANSAKRGWSLYGRLGGVVSALLGVRSEVAGNPEATRTFSFLSAGTPYRRILGSLRGGAGVQFRPGTDNWAFTLGPVAEFGLVPFNAHPAQSYLAQSLPYSFGVEAGMEFGR